MSDCNNRDSSTVTMDAIINAIKHLKELYSYVCNDIVSDCNDRDSFTVSMDAIKLLILLNI